MTWDAWLNNKITECKEKERHAIQTFEHIEYRQKGDTFVTIPTQKQDIIKATGQHLLFLGANTFKWSLDQFKQAAIFAKAHGIDSLLVKVCDGTTLWYGNMGGFGLIRATILEQGVGVIPYAYSYGNKFGALDSEITLWLPYLQECGVFCMDAEAEWNGQTAWATQLCSRMQGQPGLFLVSTWADPSLQNWQGVIKALAPCTSIFMPQQYTNSLATYWQQFGANGATWLQPTVDLTNEFGTNNPVAIAKAAYAQGHTALSVWYYDTAVANPGLLDAIYAAFPKQSGTAPTPTPNPNIIKAAQSTWYSTAHLFGGVPLDYTTGIAQAWQNEYVNNLHNMPPPTTHEFASVDWNGNPITVQYFGSTRCEWDASGQPHWYSTGF